MKNLIALIAALFLFGCVEAGEFTPKRHQMHDLNRTETCKQDSRKCINDTDIPW